MEMAPIKHAAPTPKQTTPRPTFSADPIVILSPPTQRRYPRSTLLNSCSLYDLRPFGHIACNAVVQIFG
jgi:hypothetical protein